jgi:Arf-GAP/GTPase/ANK repeat/PH domain-containing protein 1/3
MSGPKVNDKQTQQSSDMRTNTNNNSVNNSINNTINSNNGLLLTNQSYYNNSLSIRQEIHRFESVHPSIYAIYDLLELITDPLLAQQIREHVVCIEGMLTFNHLIIFINYRYFHSIDMSFECSLYFFIYFSGLYFDRKTSVFLILIII